MNLRADGARVATLIGPVGVRLDALSEVLPPLRGFRSPTLVRLTVLVVV